MKYNLYYNEELICEVSINEEKAEPFIKEMVEFWSGWKENLQRSGGYTKAFLKNLGVFVASESKLPGEYDEGWCSFDGSYGITATVFPFYFNKDDIEIEEIK